MPNSQMSSQPMAAALKHQQEQKQSRKGSKSFSSQHSFIEMQRLKITGIYDIRAFCLKLVMVEGLVAALATSSGVKLAGNGVGDARQLLLLLLEVLGCGASAVLVEPLSGLLDRVEKL